LLLENGQSARISTQPLAIQLHPQVITINAGLTVSVDKEKTRLAPVAIRAMPSESILMAGIILGFSYQKRHWEAFSTAMGKSFSANSPAKGNSIFSKKRLFLSAHHLSEVSQFLDAFTNRLPIQSTNFRHSGNSTMTHLLSLECRKQPALASIHQAQQQVDLFMQHLLWMVGWATTD
jgi:hypothetical protein